MPQLGRRPNSFINATRRRISWSTVAPGGAGNALFNFAFALALRFASRAAWSAIRWERNRSERARISSIDNDFARARLRLEYSRDWARCRASRC